MGLKKVIEEFKHMADTEDSTIHEGRGRSKRKNLVVYRLKDMNGNKRSLSVRLDEYGKLSHALYGSWQDSGIPMSLDYLGLKRELPVAINKYSFFKDLHRDIQRTLESGYSEVVKYDIITDDITPPIQEGSVMTVKAAMDFLRDLDRNQKVKITLV